MWNLFTLAFAAKPSVVDVFGVHLRKGIPHEYSDGVSISDSYFIKINTKVENLNGGAVCIYSKENPTSIRFCFFDDCSSTGFGGALYIKSESQTIELYSIYCSECMAYKAGNFAALSPRVDSRPKIDKIVIKRCGWTAKCAPAPLFIENGKPQVSYANITNNVAIKNSAIQIQGSMNMRFANILENQATEEGCLVFSNGFFNLNTINMIGNKQYSRTGASIIVSNGNLDLMHFFANNNNAEYFLYIDNEKTTIRNSFISDFKSNMKVNYEPELILENSIKFMIKISNANITVEKNTPKEKYQKIKFYNENLNPKNPRDEKNANYVVKYVVYGVITAIVIIIGVVLFIRANEEDSGNEWHGDMTTVDFENDYYLRR